MGCVAVGFFCEGGHFTLVPAEYSKIFGDEGSRVFGFGFSFVGIASLVQIVVFESLLEAIGFEGILWLYVSFSFGALFILHRVFKEEKVTLGQRESKHETATLTQMTKKRGYTSSRGHQTEVELSERRRD